MIFFPACLRGEIYHRPWEDVGHLKVTAIDVILNDLVMKSICFLFSWNGSTSLITSSKPVWKSVVKPLLGSFKIGNRWIAKCINFWLHVKIWHTFTHSQILLLYDPLNTCTYTCSIILIKIVWKKQTEDFIFLISVITDV